MTELEPQPPAEVERILREAGPADVETMVRVAIGLRLPDDRGPRLQDEIDGVVARYRAANKGSAPLSWGSEAPGAEQ